MTTPYTITKSNGSVLSLIYPYESIGPTPGGTGSSSTPVQVGCRFDIAIISSTTGQIILAGNVATLFGVGFHFTITGSSTTGNNTTTFTIGTSVYNLGLNQTFITAAGLAAASTPGTCQLEIFTVAGDQTGGRNYYQSGAAFQITSSVTLTDVGTYNVLTGHQSVYDSISGYTAIPSQQLIPATSPFINAQYQISYTLNAFSVLDMVGQNSLNWGAKIWENMLRMTEHFAHTAAPNINTNIGTNTSLIGQLWFNTTTNSYKFYNNSNAWVDLGTGLGTLSGVVTSVTGGTGISASPSTGAVTVTNTGVTSLVAGTNITLSGSTGAVTINATAGGTVTSVNAFTGGAGLTISGGPITTSGSLTITLGTELQALAGVSTLGFVQRTGAATYSISNLTGSQVNTALGYTAYSAGNPSGYISGNQTITVSGAVTGSGTTSISTTLANSGVVAGAYGSSIATSVINVNAKGLVTSAANATIAGLTPSGGSTGQILVKNSNTSYDYSWASGPNIGTVFVAGATSNLIRTGASGETADPQLSVSLGVGVYQFRVEFIKSNPAVGFFIQISYPSLSFTNGYNHFWENDGGFTYGQLINVDHAVAASSTSMVTLSGTIQTTVAGALAVTWGNAGAGGNNMTRLAGSTLTVIKCA